MPVRQGSKQVFVPCLSPLEHGAKYFSGRVWPSPSPGGALDSLVTPQINELEICQRVGIGRAGQKEKQGEEDDERCKYS